MNTKTPIFLTLLALLLFFQVSCDKDENDCPTYELPPATQTGENTIGCLVDEVVLVPRRGGLWSPYTKQFRYNDETGEMFFWIRFLAKEKDYECGYQKISMRFAADSIFSEGKVEADKFGATANTYPEYMGDLKIYRYRKTMHEIPSEIKLKITKLDTTNNIISGMFYFEMYEHISGLNDDFDFDSKLIITEGRFDFNYCPDGETIKGYSNDD